MHPDLELQEDPLPPLDPKLGPGKYKLEGSEWKHAEEDSTTSTSIYVKIVVAVATCALVAFVLAWATGLIFNPEVASEPEPILTQEIVVQKISHKAR